MEHEKEKTQFAKIQQVKENREASILRLTNVVGLGIGYKEVKGKATSETCISVYVQKKMAVKDLESSDQIPGALDDVRLMWLKWVSLRRRLLPAECVQRSRVTALGIIG